MQLQEITLLLTGHNHPGRAGHNGPIGIFLRIVNRMMNNIITIATISPNHNNPSNNGASHKLCGPESINQSKNVGKVVEVEVVNLDHPVEVESAVDAVEFLGPQIVEIIYNPIKSVIDLISSVFSAITGYVAGCTMTADVSLQDKSNDSDYSEHSEHSEHSNTSSVDCEIGLDVDEFDLFSGGDEALASVSVVDIEEKPTLYDKFVKIYPKEFETQIEPRFLPTLDDDVVSITNNNYELHIERAEHIRIQELMRANPVLVNSDEDRTPISRMSPFITWHFYNERKHPEKFIANDLSSDAKKIYLEENAGGNSENSEALSMNILGNLYGAKDVCTEMSIEYFDPNWKKCDFLCTMYNQNWGVSVTRAMSYPDPKDFTREDAERLLRKKLWGLIVAKQGIVIKDDYLKSILYIWCETPRTAGFILDAYSELDDELRDNIGVILTIMTPPTIIEGENSVTQTTTTTTAENRPRQPLRGPRIKSNLTPSQYIFYNTGCKTVKETLTQLEKAQAVE